ncbi:protein of unknown function [Paraburkholderia kururiensis]
MIVRVFAWLHVALCALAFHYGLLRNLMSPSLVHDARYSIVRKKMGDLQACGVYTIGFPLT